MVIAFVWPRNSSGCADGRLAAVTGGDTKHVRAALNSHGLLLFPPAWQILFITIIIDGCLKYKNKEKAGPMPSPHLSYDVRW